MTKTQPRQHPITGHYRPVSDTPSATIGPPAKLAFRWRADSGPILRANTIYFETKTYDPSMYAIGYPDLT